MVLSMDAVQRWTLDNEHIHRGRFKKEVKKINASQQADNLSMRKNCLETKFVFEQIIC